MIYFIMGVILFFFHLLLKMNWIVTGVLALFFLIRLPIHRKRYYEMKRQEQRFFDAALYIDTVLYAFVKERKIDAAMVDVAATLPEGCLKTVVEKAVDHLHLTFDESDVMADALSVIEQEYSCRRIRNIHSFMIHVEHYGGDMERSVDLLLEDKSHWEQRTRAAMQERRKMWVDIVLSVLVSLAICGVVMYFPVMNVDISGNVVTQIFTVIVMVLDDLILQKGQKYLAPDWLTMDEVGEDSYYEKKMEHYQNYHAARDRHLSWLLGTFAVGITILCFVIWGQWAGFVGLVFVILFLNQHHIGRKISQKTIVKGIACVFPVWLMDLMLLLQSENVQVALRKSEEHVPGILRKELALLLDRLQMNPESSEPYHAFLQEFELPEIHSAMSMLFSLSIGNSSNADQQVSELIMRNQEMMDAAQQIRMKDKNSGMYVLFLAPVMTASLKLLTDMAIFMVTFLTAAVV